CNTARCSSPAARRLARIAAPGAGWGPHPWQAGGRHAAAQAIRANARMVDQCGRAACPGPDQGFRPEEVVLRREHHRGVPRPGGLALWIVTARGQAVIADLSDGALVPRPARLVLRLLVRTEDVIISAGAGLVLLRRAQF